MQRRYSVASLRNLTPKATMNNPKSTPATPEAFNDYEQLLGCIESIATSLEMLSAVAWVMIPQEKRAAATAHLEAMQSESEK